MRTGWSTHVYSTHRERLVDDRAVILEAIPIENLLVSSPYFYLMGVVLMSDDLITITVDPRACNLRFRFWFILVVVLLDSISWSPPFDIRGDFSCKAKWWRLAAFRVHQYSPMPCLIDLFRPLMKISMRSCRSLTTPHRSVLAFHSPVYYDRILFDGWINVVMLSSLHAIFPSVAYVRNKWMTTCRYGVCVVVFPI